MMNFPFNASKRTKHFTYLIYMVIVLFSIVASYTCYVTLRDLNTDWHIVNENVWKVSEMLLFACLITGTLILIFKYLKIRNAETKRKIEWIFWGMALGVGPFIIFWLIPNIFELKYLIREEFILAFLLVVPVSFAIAVVKYHIFDIEVIIKRSLIYFFLIGILIFLYFEVIFISSNYFEKYFGDESKVFYILAAILIALMLNPLRIKIKGFVDKMFYREKYAFDKAIQKVTSVTKECHTYEELGNRILEEISTLIPVKSIAIVSTTLMRDRIRILSQNNFDLLQKNIGAFRVKNLLSRIDLPFSMAQKIEPGILFNSKLEAILKRWQIALIVPLSFDSSETVGAIVMGDKLSGLRYSQSDLQLLNTIASSTALSIKRMELQEKLFMEEVELEKANELSELKSYFVASVSHDLKTPLAAIKIFTELLQNDNITKEKTREYLSIIEGETERLKRMIDNVLNFSKIEKGLKQFNFRRINLNEATNIVMDRMNYELNM